MLRTLAEKVRPEHDATLRNIDQFFGQVATADEVIACWSPVLAAAR